MVNTAQTANAFDPFGNPANDDDDTVTLINTPTAVDLLYFRGNQTGSAVKLEWATAIEVDNYGFRLLRSATGQLADAVDLAFIPGQGYGTQTGRSYNYVDDTALPGSSYTYWLVDVDTQGVESRHGPVVVTLSFDKGTVRLYLPLITRR
jgi:hypothetical protein